MDGPSLVPRSGRPPHPFPSPRPIRGAESRRDRVGRGGEGGEGGCEECRKP